MTLPFWSPAAGAIGVGAVAIGLAVSASSDVGADVGNAETDLPADVVVAERSGSEESKAEFGADTPVGEGMTEGGDHSNDCFGCSIGFAAPAFPQAIPNAAIAATTISAAETEATNRLLVNIFAKERSVSKWPAEDVCE